MKEKIYIEINAFISDLKSDERYERKYDPLYVAIVNETEKNLRAWAAAEEAPDVAEVVHSSWSGTVCPNCGESTSFYYDCDFCPHCGAKMDEEAETSSGSHTRGECGSRE